MEARVKNQNIDLLKGLACIIVIFLHCPFPGIIGEGIIYGIRFSVPVFFMVSGYFSYSKSDEWIINKAKYILKLTLITEAIYGCWELIKACVFEQYSFLEAIHKMFAEKNIIKIVLCGSFFNGTLWYLYAIFWTWIIILILRKLKIYEKSFYLIPILLIFLIFGRFYVQNTADIYQYLFLFRNAVSFGLPFTLLGSWLSKNKPKINNISLWKNIGIFIIGLIVLVAEYILAGQYMDAHVSTVVISVALFIWAMNSQKPLNRLLKAFAYVGGKWYTWIYLSHMLFIDLLSIVYDKMNFNDNIVMQYFRPVIVCVLACACSWVIIKIQKLRSHK